MKKTMLIAALTMAATPAFASKARLSALGNAEHLSDVQRTFDRPYQAAMHGEYATLEFGSSTGTGALQGPAADPTATPNDPRAEAGFTRQISDGNYLGFYVNRQPQALVDVVTELNTELGLDSDLFALDNSFNIFYGSQAGDMIWGANLFYLAANKKAAYTTPGNAVAVNRKTDVMGVSLGAHTNQWEVDAVVGLAGKSSFESQTPGADAGAGLIGAGDTGEIESTGNYTLRGAWKMDNMYYFARYFMGGSKINGAGSELLKADRSEIEIGLVNTARTEGAEFFYGVSYVMATEKTSTDNATVAGVTGFDERKIDRTALPLVIGVEADANSWIVLRGSIRHNLPFLSTEKSVETSGGTDTGDTNTLPGQTVVATGAGLKFNRFTVDALLAASTTGTLGSDGPSFLSNASLTYSF